jgi:hypothetical protein
MSFINWGEESQKQLETRRRLEQDALYEQAIMRLKSLASQGIGAGKISKCNQFDGVVLTVQLDGGAYQTIKLYFDSLDETGSPIFKANGFTSIESGSDTPLIQIVIKKDNSIWKIYENYDSNEILFGEIGPNLYGTFDFETGDGTVLAEIKCGRSTNGICTQLIFSDQEDVGIYYLQLIEINENGLPIAYNAVLPGPGEESQNIAIFIWQESGWIFNLGDIDSILVGGTQESLTSSFQLEPEEDVIITVTNTNGACQIN